MVLRRFAVLASALAIGGSVACSSKDTHPPGTPDECTSNCDKGPFGAKAGGTPGTGGTTGDSGTNANDGSLASGLGCSTDPNFGVTLCQASLLCKGVQIDSTALGTFCGFTPGGGVTGAPDVECICNGTLLCPLASAASCASLPGLLSQQMPGGLCASPSGQCVDLQTLGTKNDGGACSPTCLQACGNSPVCITACRC